MQARAAVAIGLVSLLAACTSSHEASDAQPADFSVQAATDELFHRSWRFAPHGWHGWWCGHDHGEPQPEPETCGWQPYDDGLQGANIWGVLYDPRAPGVAYANAGDTLWQSVDGGASWHVQARLETAALVQVAPHGSDPQELLAASSDGVLQSSDAGKTWSKLSLDGVVVATLVTPPGAPLRVYAAVHSAGVFRSLDGGDSWLDPGTGYPSATTTGLSVSPVDPDSVVATLRHLTAPGGFVAEGAIVHSSDGGVSWNNVLPDSGFVTSLARCPADPAQLLAGTRHGVARSLDGGASWTVRAFDSGTTWVYGVVFSGDDCDDFYALQAGVGPRHSEDGGASYGPPLVRGLEVMPIGSFPGVLAVDPHVNSRLVLGTHGGLYASQNAGADWSLVPGIVQLTALNLSASPLEPSKLWLSTMGSGIWVRPSPAVAWQRLPLDVLPLDTPSVVRSDPFIADRVLAAGQNALYQSNDGLTFSERAVRGNPLSITFDARDPGTIYVTTQLEGMFKSSDGGDSWSAINGALTAWPTSVGTTLDVRVLVLDRSDPQALYAATNGRGVYRSLDGGGSWVQVLGPNTQVFCMIQDPDDGALYACADGIRRSDDGGTTWTDVSEGLPSLTTFDLLHDDETGDLYVTSDHGVFVKRAGDAWVALDPECMSFARGAAIVAEGGRRWLMVGAGGGVRKRAL